MKKRFVKAINRLTACLYIAACLCAVCFALPQAVLLPALAEESMPLTALVINNNQSVKYKHIPEITSFNADDALYFSDGTTLFKESDALDGAVAAKASVIFEGKLIFTATGGGIFYKQTLVKEGSFDTLTVLGQTLYAASSSENKITAFTLTYNETSDMISLTLANSYNCEGLVQNLCSTNSAVYYKLKNQTDIYTITTQGNGRIGSLDNLRSLSASASSGLLYCLTATQIISYKDDEGILTQPKRVNFSGGDFIAAGTDYIYTAVKDSGTFTIYRAGLNINNFEPFIASRGDFDYFFRAPGGVSSRFGGIFVADTNNNRVSVLSDSVITHYESYPQDGTEYFYDEPKSAALAIGGDLYVAHKNNLTNNTTGKTVTLKDASNRPLIIQKILIDTSGNIYALGRHSLSGESFAYSIDANLTAFTRLSFKNPSAIGFKVGGDVLFYEPDEANVTSGAIKDLKGDTFAVCPPVKDFCVDFSGKVFGINLSGNLISISGGNVKNHGGSYDMLTLSNIANNLAGFGDILLVESATNSLKKISASAAGVADMAAQFEVPDAQNDATPHKKAESFVASVKFDTPLFNMPTEAAADYRLLQNTDVFIRRDIEAPQDMYFVAAEYKTISSGSTSEEGRLVYGYVYKAALTPPYPYVQPQKNTGRVVLDTGVYRYIYKYPSFYSKTIREVKNGDWVKLLYFAANNSSLTLGSWFADCNGHKWVRVEILGECEGYIPELGLSWSLFTGEGSQPNANATIKENAPLYVYDKALDRYDFLDGQSFLKKGMRVEVITPFDSSAKYTRVFFSMTNDAGEVEVIDIECYVETKLVDFDGVDILQIVAIIAIIIAVILIIILIIWLTKRRKRRVYMNYDKHLKD